MYNFSCYLKKIWRTKVPYLYPFVPCKLSKINECLFLFVLNEMKWKGNTQSRKHWCIEKVLLGLSEIGCSSSLTYSFSKTTQQEKPYHSLHIAIVDTQTHTPFLLANRVMQYTLGWIRYCATLLNVNLTLTVNSKKCFLCIFHDVSKRTTIL